MLSYSPVLSPTLKRAQRVQSLNLSCASTEGSCGRQGWRGACGLQSNEAACFQGAQRGQVCFERRDFVRHLRENLGLSVRLSSGSCSATGLCQGSCSSRDGRRLRRCQVETEP